MCGLAGYNCDPDWAKSRITQESQLDLVKAGWRYNQHRGVDAAGYMSVKTSSNEIGMQKWGLSAGEVIAAFEEKKVGRMEVANVLGVHTRAATIGAPTIPANNHPVVHDGVYVTHNGHIGNHEKLREEFVSNKKMRSKLAEVDSIVIPLVLSEIAANPWEFDAVCEALNYFDGGMAIHAIWEKHPGVSLLARGGHSPLFVRWNPEGCVVYASEDNATWELIDIMNGEPNDVKWKCYDMDPGTAMLFYEGMPVEWAKFRSTVSGTHGNILASRRNVRNLDGDSVYSTDVTTDFALKHSGQVRSVDTNDLAELDIVYESESGFTDAVLAVDSGWPQRGDNTPFSRLSEADIIYRNSKADIYYGVFGNIEIVMDKYGGVKDVYNYDLSTEDRWEDLDMSKYASETKPTFNEFLEKNAREPSWVQTSHSLPKFESPKVVAQQMILQKNPTKQLPSKSGMNGGSKTEESGGKSAGPAEISTMRKITWKNIETIVTHVTEDMAFFEDTICRIHDESYSEHAEPQDCPNVMLANTVVFSAIPDLMMYIMLAPETYKQIPEVAKPQCPKLSCKWFINNERKVDFGDKFLWIPTGDKCVNCGGRRQLQHLPKYFENNKLVTVKTERWAIKPSENVKERVF